MECIDCIDCIERVYESMNISTSIVICESCTDLAYAVDSLISRSFPCVFPGTMKPDYIKNIPNKMFVVVQSEFESEEFWKAIKPYYVDCFFFLGQSTFIKSLDTLKHMKNESLDEKRLLDYQFIFTF